MNTNGKPVKVNASYEELGRENFCLVDLPRSNDRYLRVIKEHRLKGQDGQEILVPTHYVRSYLHGRAVVLNHFYNFEEKHLSAPSEKGKEAPPIKSAVCQVIIRLKDCQKTKKKYIIVEIMRFTEEFLAQYKKDKGEELSLDPQYFLLRGVGEKKTKLGEYFKIPGAGRNPNESFYMVFADMEEAETQKLVGLISSTSAV